MTSQELAGALRRIATTDDAAALSRLADELRRAHPGDPEADLLARNAEIKRRRIVQES